MDKETVFRSGNTTIELSKVVAFVELQAADTSTEGTSLSVHMADGTQKIVRGDCASKAFAQALDEHLEVGAT